MIKWGKKVAIDLGTEMTRAYVPGEGIVFQVPTLVAVRLNDGQVVAIGKEARQMMGRTPEEIISVRPVKKGKVSEFEIAVTFVNFVLKKVTGTSWFNKPEVLISVSSGITEVERKVLVEVFLEAGAKMVHVIPKPVAGAVGARVPMAEPIGSLILDIGGGLTETSLLSMGNIISFKKVEFGGVDLTSDLQEFLEKEHNLIVGFSAAEILKKTIGSVKELEKDDIKSEKQLIEDGVVGWDDDGVWMEMAGRDELTGLPNKVRVYNHKIVRILEKRIRRIGEMLGEIMRQVPPELVTDVMEKGVVMIGGGSKLRYLPEYLTELVGIPCYLAESPDKCVIEGSGRILENLEMFEYTLG